MNDTPETDKAKRPIKGFADEWVPRYVSEQLERERDEARKLAEDMRLTAEDCAAMPIATSPFWEGKRILIAWTDKAYSEGADWPSFVVERETEDGLFLRGCDAPDGTKHDGSHCFAKHDEIRDLWEWISEANAKDMP